VPEPAGRAVADPTVADPTVVDPTVVDPTVADPPQVSLAELLIEPDADRLVARTRDGRFQCETVELLGDLISQSVMNVHRLFADVPHVPRITIDRFVLQRETWRFAAGEIPVEAADDADRYRSVRGWAGAAGLPRMVFYAAPVEEKPIFLDLDSPILTEIFIKTVRRSVRQAGPLARINLTEMLPTIEQSWLTDASGDQYTSEVRVVVVDLAGTPAA
jgi:lantibiotic biosynthesis dehydratase-like protein